MRKKVPLLIVLSLIGTAALSFYSTVDAQYKTMPVSYVNRDIPKKMKIKFKLKEGKLLNIEGKEIKPHEASLSPDKSIVAYTVKKVDDWGTEPFVYLYDLKSSKELKSIPIEDDNTDKFVSGWSPDSKYILIVNKSQSVGAVHGSVYNLKNGHRVKALEMYDYSNLWKDNELIYTSPQKRCNLRNCIVESFNLNKFNPDTRATKVLQEVSIKKGALPAIKLEDNEIFLNLTVYSESLEGESRNDSEQNYDLTFN